MGYEKGNRQNGEGPANYFWRDQPIGMFSSYINWTGTLQNVDTAPNRVYQSALSAAQVEESKESLMQMWF